MRIQLISSVIAIAAVAAASADIGGPPTQSAAPKGPALSMTPEAILLPEEAARFAKQASFGPTPELINSIVSKRSIAAWIDDQFELSSSTYRDLAERPVAGNFCASKTGTELDKCYRENFSAVPMQLRFYSNAIENEDQLRQRVAFALSQIIVASETKTHNTAGLASFNQILLSNSFGNYRDIIKEASLNPFMGDYLDLADSSKTHPNENYARELMQLFSIGTTLLNPDGTPQLDSTGTAIPAYSNSDIRDISRALTGWTWSRINGAPLTDYNNRDFSSPMSPITSRFDSGQKTILGKNIPADASQEANVDAVIDAVFNHPNTPPFISKRLIQQLTLSNPTPAYVARVAATFTNNGAGVRGDMKAVIKAIYLDSEARNASQLPGKVKEPV